LKATFLQGIKIASYSGRVSHARLDAANPEKYLYIMRDSIITVYIYPHKFDKAFGRIAKIILADGKTLRDSSRGDGGDISRY
jgi:hypothetical protein